MADGPGRPIVLVGMMGSGKSTVGEQLAHRLGRRFLDTDAEMEAQTGQTVDELFRYLGEFRFRSAEADVLADALHDPTPTVIATGGGAVLRRSNRDFLRMAGAHTVWLRARPDVLAARIGHGDGRPLLDGAGGAGALAERLASIAAARQAAYEAAATTVVDVDDLAPAAVVDAILAQLPTEVSA